MNGLMVSFHVYIIVLLHNLNEGIELNDIKYKSQQIKETKLYHDIKF
jgi:hypothetical protein